MSNEMKAISPTDVFTDRTVASFTTKKGRTAEEVVQRIKAGAREELKKLAKTEQGINLSTVNGITSDFSSCTFPYPWQAPEPIYTPLNYTYFTGGPVKATKDEKKVVQMELLIKIAKETKMDINKLLALMEEILKG